MLLINYKMKTSPSWYIVGWNAAIYIYIYILNWISACHLRTGMFKYGFMNFCILKSYLLCQNITSDLMNDTASHVLRSKGATGYWVSGLCPSSRILNTRKQCSGNWTYFCLEVRGGRHLLCHFP
jgi:hypothetical protein